MGEAGFEPAKAKPSDLQSDPVGRLGIRPNASASWFARVVSDDPSQDPVAPPPDRPESRVD